MKKITVFLCFLAACAVASADIINPNINYRKHDVNSLQPYEFAHLYGYRNSGGGFTVRPKYEYASNFSEGLAAVCYKGKCGYINEKGEEVIKPQFDGIVCHYKQKNGQYWKNISCNSDSDFSEGLAAVVYKYVWYVIEGGKNYNVVFPKKYKPEYSKQVYGKISGNNFIIVKNPSTKEKKQLTAHNLYGMPKYAYIDKTGKIVFKDDEFDYAGKFKGGKAKIGTKDGYGYIDKTGEIITEPYLYKEAKPSKKSSSKYVYNYSYADYKAEYGRIKAHLDKELAKTQTPTEYNEFSEMRNSMLSSFVQSKHKKTTTSF